MLEYVFFDLDGTLTDPALGITNCIMYALDKMGREIPPRESLYCFIGPPLLYAFQKYFGMTEDEAREAIRLYRERFSTVGLFENTPYDGIVDALRQTRDMGKKLCVATSKPEEFAVRILEHFDLAQYFDMICGASMDENRSTKDAVIRYALDKTGCAPRNVLMIGDRHHDIDGAAVHGIDAMGVLWGYGSREEFEASGAKYIVSDMDEMLRIIDSIK